MQKRVIITLAVLSAAVVFAGCSKAPEGMRDGKYRAEYSEADDHGWTEYVEITVEGEKITGVDFDAVNVDGDRKSESQDYEDAMKNAGSAVGPMEYYPNLEKQLVEKQKPEDIDGVAGATTSSSSLKTLAGELKKSMAKGETATVKVKQPTQ